MLRVLELFAGIGGLAAAVAGRADVVAAIDHDRDAAETYAALFGPPLVRNLMSVPIPALAAFEADLWWMSPPCQPYTVRGRMRDLDDARAAPFVRLLDAIEAVRPRYVAVENVPPFRVSRARERLVAVLERCGYTVRERLLCPADLGAPVQRLRYYLVAGPDVRPWRRKLWRGEPLAPYLDRDAPAELDVPADLRARFGDAFHVVDADDPDAVACCFTSAYGKSPVYAGSYLRDRGRLRRFSPEEIAALHGMPASLRFPERLSLRRRWDLVGNSLSVRAVREVLDSVPALALDG